jgi:hypothetical protein
VTALGAAVETWAPLLEWGLELVRELFEDIEDGDDHGEPGADRGDPPGDG